MEITTSNKIILRFYRTTGLMTLSATAAAYLKLPNCIQILENGGFKQIIIGSCEMGEPDSFPIVGKNYSYSNSITIRSTTLQQHIAFAIFTDTIYCGAILCH